jgi:glycosyltransferase involved in cell wall biosynthesis
VSTARRLVTTADGAEAPADASPLRELVVCSLEPWDDVWRRNQFLAEELLRRRPALRILFVEPAADVLFELSRRRRPTGAHTSVLRGGRLYAFRPLKPLPRRCGSFSDRWLHRSVVVATQRLGFTQPTLWLNDVNYAPLIRRTRWPSVYDVTDDWLLAPFAPREIARLQALDALALDDADEVVVCSPALAASRGRDRAVILIPNGVDTEHFRRARPRPADLAPAPTAVYVGTLHESRLDVELIIELAQSVSSLSVVLVGPDALSAAARARLEAQPTIFVLGPRAYADVPAYLQHADIVIVPHLVTPFTESLDPIKAYECLAVQTPTVATPVAGFRELGASIRVASRESFVSAVQETLAAPLPRYAATDAASWEDRARAFERALMRAGGRAGHEVRQ